MARTDVALPRWTSRTTWFVACGPQVREARWVVRAGRELDPRTYDDYPERTQADVLSEADRLAAAKAIRIEFGPVLPVLGD